MASYGGKKQIPRRAGLPKDSRTPSLLRKINGQVRKSITPAAQMTEDQIYAPPEEDEDEVSEPATPQISQRLAAGSAKDLASHPEESRPLDIRPSVETNNNVDSDDEYAAKNAGANIKPLWGGNSKRATEQRSMAREFSASQESKLGLKRLGSSQNSNSLGCSSKRSSPNLTSPSRPLKKSRTRASEFEDAKDKKSTARGRNFSKKESEIKKRREALIQRLQEKKAAREAKKARQLTPEKMMPSFKAYDDDPFEKFNVRVSPKNFVDPGRSLLSSPTGSPRKKFSRHTSLSPESSPAKIKAGFLHESALLSQISDKSPARLSNLAPSPIGALQTLEVPFAELSDLDNLDEGTDEMQTAKALCPICKKPMDKGSLDSFFSNGGRLKINKQLQFHRLHEKNEAKNTWTTRGFPEIDWDELGTRLIDHYDFIEEIIKGGPSYYGALLGDTVKKGKNRTLMKAQFSLTPGYYGPRGLRALSEDIIGRFSSLLRERAVEDRLISSRGYSSYVEAVLVPELAVRLICEDMNVRPEKARDILEESKEIGDLLQEEVGDTVVHVDDDERDY